MNEKKREAENLNAVMQITARIISYDKARLTERA